MKIIIKEDFVSDAVTREAGERLRNRVVEALKKNEAVELDFSECMIASTSFFDEGIAKIGLEIDDISKKINLLKIHHLHRRDRELLLSLCQKRKLKIVL